MSKRAKFIEKVGLRVFSMPCCKTLICWINPRLPTYCPECGQSVLRKLKFEPECTLLSEQEVYLIPTSLMSSMEVNRVALEEY